MDIDTALEKIYSLKQFHVKLGLDNITRLLEHIGHPHKNFKSIHVAGSNGKGSTCSFLASILKEYSFNVGLYTSPHFIRFNERIRINGTEIPDDTIITFLENNRDYINSAKPTFFEITTAIAFQYFKENNVDYAVIETGLGGRLDATNILKPIASVITSISLEHTHILGDTLKKIAYEKAGIIKTNTPVFLGNLNPEAEIKIREVAKEKKAVLYNASKHFELLENGLNLCIGDDQFAFSKTGLTGKHQLKNAALAILTLSTVLGLDNVKKIKRGLDNIVMNSGIQGRYERTGKNKNIILDAAHNIEGINIFLDVFMEEYHQFNKRVLIFGAMKDKAIAKMLRMLDPFFDEIYVTSTNYERAANAFQIYNIAKENDIKVEMHNNPEELIRRYNNENSADCLAVLGSIYLLGEIKKSIMN